MPICNHCKIEKEASAFSADPRRVYNEGRSYRCKACQKIFAKRFNDSPAARNRGLIRKYGITLSQYNEMLAAQGGGCKICGDAVQLHLDHCHATEKVRGILCRGCNHGVGNFRDNPAKLRAAAEYLENSK